MKHKTSLVVTALASLTVTFTACTKKNEPAPAVHNHSGASEASAAGPADKEGASKAQTAPGVGHEDPEGYYTCSMHPQVHQHSPGTCPICGMKLIKVMPKAAAKNANGAATSGIAAEVTADGEKLRLAGIGKTKVVRKDLSFSIPVSGRFISSREVAFQVYESDLSFVKPGLEFSGQGAASGDEVLKGRIRSVDTLLDPSSRTVRVVGTLERVPRTALIDGAFHGEIMGLSRAQLAIPAEAVLHTGREDLVYRVSGDETLKPVPIRLGAKARGEYQVLSGLVEGDVIASGPNFLLDSEAKIKSESTGRP